MDENETAELKAFDAWRNAFFQDPDQMSGRDCMLMFEAWKARAALASRPEQKEMEP